MQTFGRYEILEELGKGGMAVVYRAFDPRFKREVALKVLPRALLHDDQFRARFEREAQVIAQLEHPAIVPVYDFGEQDGQPYIVMRLMTGGSLAKRIQQQGTISLAEATAILTVIAEAMNEAHERGIIHRDIKPANILFDARGKAYLSDFGIAKMLQATVSLTGSQIIIGTPAYMCPEQGRGERDIDRRSDVYALGAILFEMLSGRIPYDADTPTGQIIKHITEPVPDLCALRPDLPPSIQTVIATAMAKDRDARYPTAGHLAKAMSYVTRGLPPPPKSFPQVPQPQQAPQASPTPPAKAHFAASVSIARRLSWLTAVVILLALLFSFAWGNKKTVPLQAQTPAPTVQKSIIISSSTSTATHTPAPSPSPESPTRTPTIPPTPASPPMAAISVRTANVRIGPDTRFTVLASYPNATRLTVLGVNAQHTWLQVQLPNTNTIGWIALSTVTLDQDVALLPIVQAPSTPTLPPTSTLTPTRKPERKKSATPQDTSPPPTPYPYPYP
ncbi:MAG: hypothetical protein Fur0018_07350 [Anaerolineales bacterium]